MDYDELFPGRFLKSGELKGRDVTLKITGVFIEELPDKKGTKINKDRERVRVRGILSFEKTEKQLVLNKTNGECLKAMFGRDTDAWMGKRVTFFPATVDAFGEETLAIRVRGSPDIAADMSADINLGQKKRTAKLKRTGQSAAKPAPAPAPAPEPTPAAEPEDASEGLPEEAA